MKKPRPIEITPYLPRSFVDKNAKTLAETEKLKNNEIDPNAKYLSDKNQKAEKQTKAMNLNRFQSGATLQGAAGAQTASRPEKRGEPTVNRKNWKELSLKDLGVGSGGFSGSAQASLPSSTDDLLRDVQEGSRTILSTREYRYFSYYQRVKELLRQHWQPNLMRYATKLWQQGKAVEDVEWITRVQVILNENGYIERISRISECGITEIDDAAVEAFQKASPFPNPPRGIIEEDGLVRLHWEFVLKAENAPRIQFAPNGARGPSGGLNY